MGVFDNIGGALKGVVGQVVAAEAPAASLIQSSPINHLEAPIVEVPR